MRIDEFRLMRYGQPLSDIGKIYSKQLLINLWTE